MSGVVEYTVDETVNSIMHLLTAYRMGHSQ